MTRRRGERLYWAYGSNLHIESMRKRCPGAQPFGPLTLEGRLVFRVYADVVYANGLWVPGGLWWITYAHERALDRYEGVAGGHYARHHLTLAVDGVEQRCLYYRMVDQRGLAPPSAHYLDVVVEGYRDFGLDLDVLSRALDDSYHFAHHTRRTRQRHERAARRAAAVTNKFTA